MKKLRVTEGDASAIGSFVNSYVSAQRRERARKLLLGTSEQRIECLQALPTWLDARIKTHELRGARPKELASYANREGWLLDEKSFERIAVRDVPLSGGFGGLFVSNDAQFALLIPEVGDVVLCIAS